MESTKLGKYRLLEVAGEGGMAVVYRGQTEGVEGFRRPVAIKRIRPKLGEDARFVAMLVEEARVASEVLHPNVVQVHDFDRDEDGGYFLVMEWVQGMTMLQWCRSDARSDSRTPWSLVAAIGIEALRGLRAAHERVDASGRNVPIYHRDISAQNILLSELGHAKLSDFGIARAMDRGRVTAPGVVKGKLSHLAPEMVDGGQASRQSDIYSLGLVLWEALAGRKLFRGKGPAELLGSVRQGHIPPLSTVRDDVPDKLVDVLHQALAKDPARRFSNARDMIRALADVLQSTRVSTDEEMIAFSVQRAKHRTSPRSVPASVSQPMLLTRRK